VGRGRGFHFAVTHEDLMGTHEDPMGTNGRAMKIQGDPWGPSGGGGGGEGPVTPIPLLADLMTHWSHVLTRWFGSKQRNKARL
jgi:hypothetical protein